MRFPRWWRGRRNPARLGCREVGRILQTYLDAELEDESAALVTEHLEMCARCGLEAATYAELKEALRHRVAPLPSEPLERLQVFAHQLAAGQVDLD